MGLLDKALRSRILLTQVKGLVEEHGDQIANGLDKVAQVVDERTKGRYSDKIETGVATARKYLGEKGAVARPGEVPPPPPPIGEPEAGSGRGTATPQP